MAEWNPPQGHGGRWILACVAGLAAGTALGTLWNAWLLPAMLPVEARGGALAIALQALAGVIIGACLGAAQAPVVRRAYPDLPAAAWIGMTAAAGYLVALLTNLIFSLLAQYAGSIPIPVFILLGASVKGIASGLLYGAAQGRVLGRSGVECAGWTRVVTVGWMLGALLGSMRWMLGLSGGDVSSLLLGGVLGGAVEGLALGLVTAGAFRFMPPRSAPRSLP